MRVLSLGRWSTTFSGTTGSNETPYQPRPTHRPLASPPPSTVWHLEHPEWESSADRSSVSTWLSEGHLTPSPPGPASSPGSSASLTLRSIGKLLPLWGMWTWRPSTGTSLGWWGPFTKVGWKEAGSENPHHQRSPKCLGGSPSPQAGWFNHRLRRTVLWHWPRKAGLSLWICPAAPHQASEGWRRMKAWEGTKREVCGGAVGLKAQRGSNWVSVCSALSTRRLQSWWPCICRSTTPVSPDANGAPPPS